MFKREEKKNSHKRKKILFILFFSLFFLLSSCGEPKVLYRIEDPLTNEDDNKLVLEANTPNKLQFKLVQTKGPKSLKASVPFDEFIDVQEVTFSYKKEGVYGLTVTTITKSDKLIVHEENVEWEYSEKSPPTPLIEITGGDYTRKDIVNLKFDKSNLEKDHDITEIWVAGDLDDNPKGAWYSLTDEFELNQTLSFSPTNGLKTIKAKYRNAFGSEGPISYASVIRKRNKPTNCIALFSDIDSGGIIHTDELNFTLSVTDYIEGVEETPENFYRIKGTDGTETDWSSFEEKVKGSFKLKDPVNEKRYLISVEVKDIAGNKCDMAALSITYDPERALVPHLDFIDIRHPLWTLNEELTIRPYHPLADDEVLELYIYGDIWGDNTYTWLPYDQEEDGLWDIKLNSGAFNKWVRVAFRVKEDETLLGIQEKPLFLDPYINLKETEAGLSVYAARFTDESMDTITITGCEEEYNEIPYEYNKAYSCTPVEEASKISITHVFSSELDLEEEDKTLTLEKPLP